MVTDRNEGSMTRTRVRVGEAEEPKERPAVVFKDRPPEGFEAREGDVLFVSYSGAKLSIAQYSNVELDSASYSRKLRDGDNVAEEWDRVYTFLKNKAVAGAKEKLRTYADELNRARLRARGQEG